MYMCIYIYIFMYAYYTYYYCTAKTSIHLGNDQWKQMPLAKSVHASPELVYKVIMTIPIPIQPGMVNDLMMFIN